MPNELKSQKVGLKFKLARSKLNLSLEDISKDILINIKYLKAIEEDNYSIFPARTFALAYYKKYSQFLGITEKFPLSEDEILKNDKTTSTKTSSMQLAGFEEFIRDNFIKIIIFILLSITFIAIISFSLINDNTSALDQIELEAPVTQILDINDQEDLLIEPMPNNYNLLLIFSGPCWVEIYADNKKPLIYKLYNNNEILEIEIKKSFTLIIGNIDNVIADYAGKNINLIDSANEQKVSITTFKNE
tara:strand:- start:2873 stop:3610 length:738 start_codon:yes stop_codon:yes gene_type:complete